MSARTVALLILVSFPLLAAGQSAGPSVEERLRRLEQRQEETDRQIREKDARIQELERQLQTAGQPAVAAPTPAPGEPAVVSPAAVAAAPTASLPSEEAPATVPAKPDKWGAFEPGKGFDDEPSMARAARSSCVRITPSASPVSDPIRFCPPLPRVMEM